MPAGYVEIYLDQGTNFNNVINLTDDVTNEPINTAGYSAMAQIRRSHWSSNISANIVCTFTNNANGELTLSMTAANTARIKAGRYVFDVKVTDNTGYVTRPLEGIITVTPQVSK